MLDGCDDMLMVSETDDAIGKIDSRKEFML